MENDFQNIPYFKFYVEPQCGEKVSEILNKVADGFIHYLKISSEVRVAVTIPKDTHLFNYISPLARIQDNSSENEDVSNIYSIEDLKTLRSDGEKYFAASDGVLVCYDSKIKFIPILYDSVCDIEISEDKKNATATFYPAASNGKQLIVTDVIKKIREQSITAPLEKLNIVKALELVKNRNEVIENIIVAKEKEPKPGKAAWVEYLFDTNKKAVPIIDENGNIDFHNLNLIESVTENQKIGIFHPMIEGEDGTDLFGKIIIAPKLKDTNPPKGKNIYYREEEPNHILSKIDGHISLVGNDIVITNLYNIRGDVDFHTGNVVSKGSLNITKNVKSGFNLEMSENITIGGYVKDSEIKSGGDISIRGGFSGTGKGKITAGGNVNIRYIRNQEVYSRGDIIVEKEVVEAKLFAKGDIKSASNRMMLVGGSAVAGGNIIVNTLGHEYGMETRVEAGSDYVVKIKLKVINDECKIMKKDLSKLKEQIATSLAGGSVGKLAKALLIKQQLMKKQYELLQKKRSDLQASVSALSGAKITVSGNIYPGVKIYIDGYKFKVKELMNAKLFYASVDEEGIVVTDV